MDVAHDADPASEVREAEHDDLPAGTEQTDTATDPNSTRRTQGGKARAWLDRRRRAADPGVDWIYGTTLATKLLQGAFILAVIAGPVAVGISLLPADVTGPTTGTGEGSGGGPGDLQASNRAEVAAEQLVTTWLTATLDEQDRILDLVAAAPTDEIALPEKRPAPPTQVWAADSVPTAPDTWQVTVGAITGGQTTWYAVTVRATAESAQALSLPGHAPSPPAEQSADPFPEIVDAGDPAADTVAGYVQALLTGSGDLDRWTSPDAHVAPVDTAPCETTELLEVRSPEAIPAPTTNGQATSVLASALCVSGQQTTSSQYPLTLTARDGRWEVSTPGVTDSDPDERPTDPPATSKPNTSPESHPTR